MIPAALRPFLAALLTLPLRSLAGWLTARGIEMSGDQVSDAVEAVLVWGWPILSVLGIVARRYADKWINPLNTASSHLAVEGKLAASDIKRAEKSAQITELVETEPGTMFRPPQD